jgi:hypothetical protein
MAAAAQSPFALLWIFRGRRQKYPRQSSMRTPAEVMELAVALRRENPDRTAAGIRRILRAQPGWSPDERTLQRHFTRLGLTRSAATTTSVFGQFEAEHSNDHPVCRSADPRAAGMSPYAGRIGGFRDRPDGRCRRCRPNIASPVPAADHPTPAAATCQSGTASTNLHPTAAVTASITVGPARSAADAIALGARRIVNIKPGRIGGYLEARRVHDVCAAHGVPVWCGGMLETGLGRAANVALASLPRFTLPGDTSASDRFCRTDITDPLVLADGHLPVPAGPGLAPIPAALAEVTTERV